MCYARRQRSSWARIKLSNKLYSSQLPLSQIIRAFFGSLLCFEYVPCFHRTSFQRISEISHSLFCLYFNLLLFNCQWSIRLPLLLLPSLSCGQPLSCGQLDYYITFVPVCQGVFQNFLKKFFQPLPARFLRPLLAPAPEVLRIIPYSHHSCQGGFSTFFGLFETGEVKS